MTAKEAWSRALGARRVFLSESSARFDAIYRKVMAQIEDSAARGYFAMNLSEKFSEGLAAWEKTALLESLTYRLGAEGFIVKPNSSTELHISWET